MDMKHKGEKRDMRERERERDLLSICLMSHSH